MYGPRAADTQYSAKKAALQDAARIFLCYSCPASNRSRTSYRSWQQRVYNARISSSGWARSGTITVTAPAAWPARTPLKLSSSTRQWRMSTPI